MGVCQIILMMLRLDFSLLEGFANLLVSGFRQHSGVYVMCAHYFFLLLYPNLLTAFIITLEKDLKMLTSYHNCAMVQLYCSEQIAIPQTFPNILKTFAKDAIRTQPYDVLRWSAAYFRCLANNAPLPAKIRLERECRQGSLTKGYLKVLISQVGKGFFINRCLLQEKWKALCLPEDELFKYLSLSRMLNWPQIHWLKLVSVMIGSICATPLESMVMVCELLTDDPDGGLARIPYWMFKICYTFLAKLECSQEQCFVNGQMVLPWGALEDPTPMDTIPRILSATLLKDTIVTSCKAKFDKPYEEECGCPQDSPSGTTVTTDFMINSMVDDPKELLTKCEDFDTIMLVLENTQEKKQTDDDFKDPHFTTEAQLKKARKITNKIAEQQRKHEESTHFTCDRTMHDATQMVNEVGPPWTWLHQFTINDFNTFSYNFIDQESIASTATPRLTSDLIKDEPECLSAISLTSDEKSDSMDNLKQILQEATKLKKCDLENTSSIISVLKSEELRVLQDASEPYRVPDFNLNDIVAGLERAEANGIVFTNIDQLMDHIKRCFIGNIDDFPPIETKTEAPIEKLSAPSIEVPATPRKDNESIEIPPEWAEDPPPKDAPIVIQPEAKEEVIQVIKLPSKEEMFQIFESTVGVNAEQASKMPAFCFEKKDQDELILGLVPVIDPIEEVEEEEDMGTIYSDSGDVNILSGEGYRQDVGSESEDEKRRTKASKMEIKSYCCDDAPSLLPKTAPPPPQKFQCSFGPIPGIGRMVSQKIIDEFLAFLRARSRSQRGLVHPRNFREEKCPYMMDTCSQ